LFRLSKQYIAIKDRPIAPSMFGWKAAPPRRGAFFERAILRRLLYLIQQHGSERLIPHRRNIPMACTRCNWSSLLLLSPIGDLVFERGSAGVSFVGPAAGQNLFWNPFHHLPLFFGSESRFRVYARIVR
jgi:hypothetical protein